MEVLHRAKSLYSNEYIISDSVQFKFNQMYLYFRPNWVEHSPEHHQLKKGEWIECDEATRSIHLSGVVDSGGTKLFASLSEDGKGGDTLQRLDDSKPETILYKDFTIGTYMYRFEDWKALFRFKVTGIQE